MANVSSTVTSYRQLLDWEEGEPRRRAWTDVYEASHPEIFAKYYEGWGDPEFRHDAADSVAGLAPKVSRREMRARALVSAAGQNFVDVGLFAEPDIPTVLLVGGHTSNGWVAEFNGQATLFLALEMLGPAPYDDILVVHESLHVAHAQYSMPQWPATVAANLFLEGLAVAMSRRLRPGLMDSAYLWFGNSNSRWVADCQGEEHRIRAHVLDDLESTSAEKRQSYFSISNESTLPSRCGYWLGDKIITDLIDDGTDPKDLLQWGYEETLVFLQDCLL